MDNRLDGGKEPKVVAQLGRPVSTYCFSRWTCVPRTPSTIFASG